MSYKPRLNIDWYLVRFVAIFVLSIAATGLASPTEYAVKMMLLAFVLNTSICLISLKFERA